MPRKGERKWAEIEEEFGKPIERFTYELRESFTFKTIAAMYGVHEETLRRWCKIWGWDACRSREEWKYDEFSFPETTPTDVKARELGYDDMADAVRELKLNQLLTDREIAGVVGCCKNSVYDSKPRELVGLMVVHTRRGRELR